MGACCQNRPADMCTNSKNFKWDCMWEYIGAMLIIIMMYEEICVLILIKFDVHTSQLLLLGSMANNHVAMITDSGIVIHSPSIAITSQNRDLLQV